MAGSYDHVMDGWSLIENMGDAHEACECDEYHGFTCPIHSDRQLAHDALKALYSR